MSLMTTMRTVLLTGIFSLPGCGPTASSTIKQERQKAKVTQERPEAKITVVSEQDLKTAAARLQSPCRYSGVKIHDRTCSAGEAKSLSTTAQYLAGIRRAESLLKNPKASVFDILRAIGSSSKDRILPRNPETLEKDGIIDAQTAKTIRELKEKLVDLGVKLLARETDDILTARKPCPISGDIPDDYRVANRPPEVCSAEYIVHLLAAMKGLWRLDGARIDSSGKWYGGPNFQLLEPRYKKLYSLLPPGWRKTTINSIVTEDGIYMPSPGVMVVPNSTKGQFVPNSTKGQLAPNSTKGQVVPNSTKGQVVPNSTKGQVVPNSTKGSGD